MANFDSNRQPNNYVAQSDYDAAIHAVANFPSHSKSKLFQDSRESMITNLKRVAQVISDEAYHKHVDPYHFVDFDEEDGAVSQSRDDLAGMYERMEDNDSEEYDDSDLFDPKALHQAQSLREQVRQLAERVQKLRDDVMQRALGLSSKAMAMRDDFRPKLSLPNDLPPLPAATVASLAQMLKNSNFHNLPNKMQIFQETLEAIKGETREDRPLSQTEQAILSRDGDDCMTPYVQLADNSTETPKKRLANFFLLNE